jgi:nucleoside-diphosphate-sugar epimerase
MIVTGGAGFVGSNLVHALLRLPVRAVTIVDNLLSADRVNVPVDDRVTFVHGSIADPLVLDALDADGAVVFHLATYHGNQSSIHDPLADHDNNLLTSLRLFDALARRRSVRRIVYAGAGCAVAEKTVSAPAATREDASVSLQMDSPYSISKLVGEMYGLYYHAQHALPVVRARFQNVYGPREILGAGEWRGTPATVWRNVTPTFIYKALHGEALPIEGDGSSGRDFIYVDDIVEGLLACAERGVPGDVYNLATGFEVSIRELAERVNRLTGSSAALDFRPARSWDHSGRRFGDPLKAQRELGFRARVSHEEGVRRTIAWTREALPAIERCVAQHAGRLAAA